MQFFQVHYNQLHNSYGISNITCHIGESHHIWQSVLLQLHRASMSQYCNNVIICSSTYIWHPTSNWEVVQYRSVPQIRPPPSRISPPCIFSGKSCGSIFIPRISPPPFVETPTQSGSKSPWSNCSARRNPACTEPLNIIFSIKVGGRNRERKCRTPRISPPCALY